MSIAIKTLGEFEVYIQGEPVVLPPSKVTRALLAYLAVTGRPHRRNRLCEIFWSLSDDPKGALRWSLSKIRGCVNNDNEEYLVADRERVSLFGDNVLLDISSVTEQARQDALSLEELKSLYDTLSLRFLEGLDFPEHRMFNEWLVAERRELEKLKSKIVSQLACHKNHSPLEKLHWSELWLEIDPFNVEAANCLVAQLQHCGKKLEATELQEKLAERFANANINWDTKKESFSTLAGSSSIQKKTTEINDQDKTASVGFAEKRNLLSQQKIQFCTAKDGVRLAYATIGKGTPIIKAANWLSHLEYDWDAPIWSPLFRKLAQSNQFIRYDERGNGLSDWQVRDLSFNSFVDDLETVVDATGIERFVLLGISQGAAVSIEYAYRYPERVSHLILFGGYAAGWRIDADDSTRLEREAVITLTRNGWGQDNPAYRQIFSHTFMPSAKADELAWFNEFQRLTTTPENAARFLSVFGDIDVRDRLEKLTVPTLVIHSVNEQRIPVQTAHDIAAKIPKAKFVGLESDGHLLLGREPASDEFVNCIRDFLQ